MSGKGKIHNFKEKMVKSKAVIPFMVLALAISCNSPKSEKEQAKTTDEAKSEIKGTFVISGAYAIYPVISRMADEFMLIHPGVRIEGGG